MTELMTSFGRALLSFFDPRVMWRALWPLALAMLFWLALLMGYGSHWIDAVRDWLANSTGGNLLADWFGNASAGFFAKLGAPLLVGALVIIVMLVSTLLLLATLAMPAVVRVLGARHYAQLVPRHGGSFWGSMSYSLGSTLLLLVLLIVTLPMWLFPPLAAVLQWLLWGWFSCRVMTYDALAWHASAAERRQLMREHRWQLITIGVLTSLAATLPSALLSWSIIFTGWLPILVLVVFWLYVLLFVFSALWFAQYCLRALQRLREAADNHLTIGDARQVRI